MSEEPKIVNPPQLLPYGKIKNIEKHRDLVGIFGYVIKNYEPGASVVIGRNGQTVAIRMGDWDGNETQNDKLLKEISANIPTLTGVMSYAGVPHAQYYFTKDNKLVDMRLSINKFAGPGMLRDLFAKCLKTQDIIKTVTLSEDEINQLKNTSGKYIFKPSRFRFFEENSLIYPLYTTI